MTGFLGHRTFGVATRSSHYRNNNSRVAKEIAVGWVWLLFRFLALVVFLMGLALLKYSNPVLVIIGGILLAIAYSNGPSWGDQKRKVALLINEAALEDDAFFEFGERTGLFTIETWFKGPSVDFMYYVARVDFITDKVLGPEFRHLIEQTYRIDTNENPEDAEPLYCRAYELLRECYQRFERNPENYRDLVAAGGRPGVDEALRETFISYLVDEYIPCLGRLVEKHKKAERYSDARECERRMRAVEAFEFETER